MCPWKLTVIVRFPREREEREKADREKNLTFSRWDLSLLTHTVRGHVSPLGNGGKNWPEPLLRVGWGAWVCQSCSCKGLCVGCWISILKLFAQSKAEYLEIQAVPDIPFWADDEGWTKPAILSSESWFYNWGMLSLTILPYFLLGTLN